MSNERLWEVSVNYFKVLYRQSQGGSENTQGYSEVPPGIPNSTAQQPRQTRQKGVYQ